MDEICVCLSKFHTNPPEIIICPLHPCICLETQDLNCLYCWSEIERLEAEEEEEVEVEEVEQEQEQEQADLDLDCYEESLDLTCYEDFETAVEDPLEEVSDLSGITQYQKYLIATQNWRRGYSRPASTLTDYLEFHAAQEAAPRWSTSNIADFDYLYKEVTFERKRRDTI